MSTETVALKPEQPARLQSIDALRGFDMFWIMGADGLVKTIAKWLGLPSVADQFSHVKWDGFHFYDLIFPLFLFVVGVVLPFSLSKYSDPTLEKPPMGPVYARLFRRAFLLFFLGLMFNGFLNFDFSDFRWLGVLQRIALCYLFAALIVVNLNITGQAIVTAAIVIGYWALFKYVAAPGSQPFDLTIEGSLAGYVDRTFLPGKLYYKFGDNEGLLTTVPAIATTMMGVLAGHCLRSKWSPVQKLVALYIAAALCLTAGYLWSYSFPLNKILYTSSFVMVTGGWCLTLLATFYLIIDVIGFRSWSFFFTVIGMNAITIYMMARFVDFQKISVFFLGGVANIASRIFGTGGTADAATPNPDDFAKVTVIIIGVLAAKWLVLWYLYRNKTFLRV